MTEAKEEEEVQALQVPERLLEVQEAIDERTYSAMLTGIALTKSDLEPD